MSQQKAQLVSPIDTFTPPGIHVTGAGIVTATSFVGSGGTVTAIADSSNLNVGVVTATTLYGNGENLEGASGAGYVGQTTAAQSGTTTIDLSVGNIIYFTQDTDTTVAFASTEAVQELIFIRTKDDTTDARTITWPASIIWNGGTAPTLIDSSDANDVQIFNITTRDQGVTWYGYEAMKNDPAEPPSGVLGYYMSGSGGDGRMGQNDQVNRSSPIQIVGTWSRMHKPSGYALGIQTDGSLWAWGSANLGTLGLNNAIQYSSPTQVGTDTDWSGISGSYSNAATKTDGTLWMWGWNSYGDLGFNDAVNYSSPKQLPGTQWSVDDCYTGSQNKLVRQTDGTLWVWGRNYAGVLGLNQGAAALMSVSSPHQIGVETDWNSACSTNMNAYATKTDGSLWSWGYNARGSLGQNEIIYQSSPVQIPGQWQKVMCQMDRSATFLQTDGSLWSWGNNGNGQLGLNSIVQYSSPVQVGSDTTWSHLTGGDDIKIATKTDGSLWAWGNNSNGQLGLGDEITRSSPVQVPGTWSITTSFGFDQFTANRIG